MILKGRNLGERHRDLNSRVAEAAARLINFEEVKSQPENCDVDKLFKIDLASKYKNIDYILEVLQCSDIFYISRALKCIWIYKDEYAQYINTNFLENNIFPSMSVKMKKKMLTAISTHVRNAERILDFYKYCKDARLNLVAAKFLAFTPDSFKLYLITTRNFVAVHDSKLLKQFIGSSFELAVAYLDAHDYSPSIILKLDFLYYVSEKEYLKLLECIQNDASYPYCSSILGIRMSKSILKKHKQRVLNKPLLYVNILHKDTLVKHLTTVEVESLAPRLLPKYSRQYWSLNFYDTYKFILQKIPTDKLYGYMKHIYISKYKRAEFQMNIEFYKLKYYEMLDIGEREVWAVQHIKRDKEIPGIKTYDWYKFVRFQNAFPEIKRYIYLTPDNDERSRIVNILPETARNQKDIKKLLNYYYGRHINESACHKVSFMDKVVEVHDIYSFNDECWRPFEKLLYSLNVYKFHDTYSFMRWSYRFIVLAYYILHEMDMPEGIMEYFENIESFYHFWELIEKLTVERKTIVANYLLRTWAQKIESLLCHPDYNASDNNFTYGSGNIKFQIIEHVCIVWSIIYAFQRPVEDCPAVVVQFMESNMDIYQDHYSYKQEFKKKSEADFLRWLKQDTGMAVEGISEIRCNAYRWNFRLCLLFRKLKVYFSNDVAKDYLKYFMGYLSDVPKGRREYRNIKMAVVGVFYLGDPESIIRFVEKNVPTSPKIDHWNMDIRILQVQKAICRLAYHPRPPLPLTVIQKYITGDYVHYCLPTIYNYFTTLPSSAKFIDSLLDAPISIQKHGLRLAFRSYDAETLSVIITNTWKKTKNVSLRMVLYETLFNRILKENMEVQKKLFKVLKLYTSELNHHDQDSVYSLLMNDDFPETFKGDFIETAWLAVNKLTEKSIDIKRRIDVIRHMEKNTYVVHRDFLRQIIDIQIEYLLSKKNIDQEFNSNIQELIDAKWQLAAKYIVSYNDEIEQQESLRLIQRMVTDCFKTWNLVKDNTYVVRKFFSEFIETIIDKDPKTVESCGDIAPIYQCILDNLKASLKTEETYLINWKLKLILTSKSIIRNGIDKGSDNESDSDESKNMDCKEIAHLYGKAIAKMLVRSVKNDDFFYCFYELIADIVNNVGSIICDILDIDNSGFVYYVCESLIKTKISETHLLALLILPKDGTRKYRREHRHILSDVKNQFVSDEVYCFLYEKYVLSDYRVRKYLK